MKTPREILWKLIPNDIRNNPYTKDIVDQAEKDIEEYYKLRERNDRTHLNNTTS